MPIRSGWGFPKRKAVACAALAVPWTKSCPRYSKHHTRLPQRDSVPYCREHEESPLTTPSVVQGCSGWGRRCGLHSWVGWSTWDGWGSSAVTRPSWPPPHRGRSPWRRPHALLKQRLSDPSLCPRIPRAGAGLFHRKTSTSSQGLPPVLCSMLQAGHRQQLELRGRTASPPRTPTANPAWKRSSSPPTQLTVQPHVLGIGLWQHDVDALLNEVPQSPGIPVDVPTGKALVGHVKVREEVPFLPAKKQRCDRTPGWENLARRRQACERPSCIFNTWVLGDSPWTITAHSLTALFTELLSPPSQKVPAESLVLTQKLYGCFCLAPAYSTGTPGQGVACTSVMSRCYPWKYRDVVFLWKVQHPRDTLTLTFTTDANSFHCSCRGSTPVGLWAHACKRMMLFSGIF